jgi:hypothetical protein
MWCWFRFFATISAAAACDFTREICNTVSDKIPLVIPVSKAQSVEFGLNVEDQKLFEHLVGWGLVDTPEAKWITINFMKRLTDVLIKAASFNGTTADSALLQAFGTQYYNANQHNTGYVGPSLEAIKYASLSEEANLRERWALVYILTKTRYIDMVLNPLAAKANQTGDFTQLTSLGLNVTAVMQRYKEVFNTSQMPSADKYSNGIPDWSFEAFESWVRFDFDGPNNSWVGARVSRPEGCYETNLTSNDPSIHPPLSKYEQVYQCGSNSSCKLQWYPGSGCYTVKDVPFQTAPLIPGYATRAQALGYRTACGPSGTMANYLQYGRLLNFTQEELVLVRIAGLAAMLPVDDHSIYELMLGADDFMTAEFRIPQSLTDLSQLLPRPIVAFDRTSFYPQEVYGSLCQRILIDDEGFALFNRMTIPQQNYLVQLFNGSCSRK